VLVKQKGPSLSKRNEIAVAGIEIFINRHACQESADNKPDQCGSEATYRSEDAERSSAGKNSGGPSQPDPEW